MGLHLWVMEGVLHNYTAGVVCVLAHDEAEAWALLEKADPTACSLLRDYDEFPDLHNPVALPPAKFRRVDAPEAFVCWGGG